MDADPLLLSRIQFAFTIGFHIVYPTLTIGLALYLVLLEGRWLATGEAFFKQAARFWSKLFALSFVMGVVSGVVLSYEIGTNFGHFSEATGNVLGPLMSYEVLTAFFLEAGFLGIMLFGWERIGKRVHFASTILVALGTVLSSFWILSANSWMQTPNGFRFVDGTFFVTSWLGAIFNPSFLYRLAHMLNAAYLTTAFVVASVAAWYVLRNRHRSFGLRALRFVIPVAAILAPLQLVLGDLHGLNTREHQPIKIAAMEAHWETQQGAPLILFALPDQQAADNHFAISIQKLGSLILTHDLEGEVQGLEVVPPQDRPYVPLVFFAFRTMVGIGLIMIALAWRGTYLLKRERLASSQSYLMALSASGPIGFIAVIAGWITTEAGRQPWVVQGWLRTEQAVSAVTGHQVVFSLALFLLVYAVLFAAFLAFFLAAIRKGPAPSVPKQTTAQGDLPRRERNDCAPSRPAKLETRVTHQQDINRWTSR